VKYEMIQHKQLDIKQIHKYKYLQIALFIALTTEVCPR